MGLSKAAAPWDTFGRKGLVPGIGLYTPGHVAPFYKSSTLGRLQVIRHDGGMDTSPEGLPLILCERGVNLSPNSWDFFLPDNIRTLPDKPISCSQINSDVTRVPN